MRLFIERQNDLVVCRLRETDHWFFTACYRGVRELLGFAFPAGSKFELELTATAKEVMSVAKKKGKKKIKPACK
jgi:hypothetical protein